MYILDLEQPLPYLNQVACAFDHSGSLLIFHSHHVLFKQKTEQTQ